MVGGVGRTTMIKCDEKLSARGGGGWECVAGCCLFQTELDNKVILRGVSLISKL